MTPIDLTGAIIAFVAFALATSFMLGYAAAETRERRAHTKTKKNLQNIQLQKTRLTQWVRENWPNEFEAYRRGHLEGYQQGIYQSAEFDLMPETTPLP